MTPAEAVYFTSWKVERLRVLLCFLLYLIPSQALLDTTWWSSVAQLGVHHHPDVLLVSSRPLCSQLPGLSAGQARICELFMDHMPAVGQGARQAIEECQWQFKDRRWNCSTPYGSNVFGPVHLRGTREAAFTYSIIAAGVTHEVGRSCRQGLLSSCGCSEARRPKELRKEWMWGGCGDNLEYGYDFSRNFIDIREREHDHPKDSAQHGRALMNRWNNEVGRKEGYNTLLQLVKRETKVTCKCHGVSGSCNLKTCWRQLPDMRQVSDVMREKYDDAVRVRISRRGNMQLIGGPERKSRKRKSANRMDLVYLDESPDYCRKDMDLGTLGTTGRICNKTGNSMDSCELLCCGRGYSTFKEILREKCNCKFEWCCRVVCKVCVTKVDVHICK